MRKFWNWLGDETNRGRLAFLGGGLAAILTGGWAVYLHFQDEPAVVTKIEAPDEPIEIKLDVKIDHTIRTEVEKDLDDMFAQNDELF